jgi:hypothetical protein
MRRVWYAVATHRERYEQQIFALRGSPIHFHLDQKFMEPEGALLTRDEAIRFLEEWRDYNKYWNYYLIEDDSWTPKLFDERGMA